MNLIEKYNVAGPRYTSYPTVPFWEDQNFTLNSWKEQLKKSFAESNKTEGISVYIHLPFCESLCTFCGCNKRITKNHDVETPYINAVIAEWELYCEMLGEKPIVKELHLGGGTPTFFSVKNLQLLMKGIFKFAERHPEAEFSFEGHPNNTTEQHLKILGKLGFTRVSFGVQDYNPAVQKAIHRIQPFENVRKVTNWAREAGFTSIGHDLVFGLPFQTAEDIVQSIMRTKELMPDRIAFYSYAHVPWIKGNGQRGFKEEDLPDASEKRLMYEIGKKMLQESGYVEIGMDHFALKTDSLYKALEEKKIHRNFMGYTSSKTKVMIGLGVSAISDCWYGFAQNAKGVEEYESLVCNGILPVYRGHILNEEDLIIRKHILNLMCKMETSWEQLPDYIPEIRDIKNRLLEMSLDGVVEMGDHGLKIPQSGRPFVRNVCMAFDLRLQRQKPDTQLFSMTI
ncbi:oxygen-independent coproporphyrinogen III oxidase [Christiangramia fulva]|uniref:Coproporphyrinogen-III oxidase n=1 Tax=Christiangramia fulva TaxID=2126553 RepID=A0A2R3Z2A7_9FLAO|nr:oxygen-independent coproporphyrinogen III oxidase [Christiangramia fulva]AVR44372.1 oxygen-independent coproporphyrinogen III oxidase [Christiangramia fulva]